MLQLTAGGKGANLNVFVEASTSWEKRQAALQSKVRAEQGWAFWQQAATGPAAGSSMGGNAAPGGGASSSLGRGVNAATVAASARRWRDYQRSKRTRDQRLLTTTSSVSSTDEVVV